MSLKLGNNASRGVLWAALGLCLAGLLPELVAQPGHAGPEVLRVLEQEHSERTFAFPCLNGADEDVLLVVQAPGAGRRLLLVSSGSAGGVPVHLPPALLQDPAILQAADGTWVSEAGAKLATLGDPPYVRRLRAWPLTGTGAPPLQQMMEQVVACRRDLVRSGTALREVHLVPEGAVLITKPAVDLKSMVGVAFLYWEGGIWGRGSIRLMPEDLAMGLVGSAPLRAGLRRMCRDHGGAFDSANPVTGEYISGGRVMPVNLPVLTAAEVPQRIAAAQGVARIDKPGPDAGLLAQAFLLEIYDWGTVETGAAGPRGIAGAFLSLGLRQPPWVYRPRAVQGEMPQAPPAPSTPSISSTLQP